jgi:hypothetical protein
MVRSWSEVGNKVPRMDPEKKVEEKRTLRLSNAVYYPLYRALTQSINPGLNLSSLFPFERRLYRLDRR